MLRFDHAEQTEAARTTRADQLRRLLHWLNLTLLQHATWPAVVLLTGATYQPVSELGVPDLLLRLIGPVVAATIALSELRRLGWWAVTSVPGALAGQIRLLIPGVALMLAVARIVAGPVEETVKALLVGLADVAAFHLITFGVAAALFPTRPRLLVGLFALSWGLREVAYGLIRSEATQPLYALASGLTIGLLVALGALLLMRWPGGRLTAPAAHWLALYLIAGYSS